MTPAALTMERVLGTLAPFEAHFWGEKLATTCLTAGVEAGDGWIIVNSLSKYLLRWGWSYEDRRDAKITVGRVSWERPMPLPLPVHTICLTSPLKPVPMPSMAKVQDTWRSRYAPSPMSALRTQWGLPPYSPFFIVVLDNLPGWDGYVLSVWGTFVHTTPHMAEAPLFHVRGALRNGGMLSLVAWVRQVFYRDTAAHLSARWHPEIGVSIEMNGKDAYTQFARLPVTLEEKLKRGLQLLDEASLKRPGRRTGSTAISAPEFSEQYAKLYHQLWNPSERPPTHEQVASKLGITERTLYRYLEQNGLSWPPP